MQNRTCLKPVWPIAAQFSAALAVCLLFVLPVFALLVAPGGVCASEGGEQSMQFTFGKPDVDTRRTSPAAAPSLQASRAPKAPAAESVRYEPLDENAAKADTSSGQAVMDPARKAAQRAEAFRLSQAGKQAQAQAQEQAQTQSQGHKPAVSQTDAESQPEAKDVENTLDTAATAGATVPDEPMNFEECVHLALQQSPFFVESAMEVQLRRLDESDSWWKLLPKFLVSTGYVLTGPRNLDDSDRFSLSFSTGGYDPIAAGFSIQATKLVTKIAILGHMNSINQGLYNLGNMFLHLGHLRELLIIQEELVSLAKHEKTYLGNLLETGGTNPLEVRIAEQKLEMAVLGRESLEAQRDELMDDLKIFLGLGVQDRLKLELKDAEDQVLGYFRPEEISTADVAANNIELRIQQQQREIQEYNVKLAWANYLPKFYVQTRTANPIDTNNADDGLYTSVGFTWTLWDWGERYRNVRRQRMNTRQDVVKENILELDISSDWRSGMTTKRRTRAALKHARAEVELAGLLKRQSEISYQAGSQPFPAYLSQIRNYFHTRKEALNNEYEDNKAMLDLRFMSGDLFNSYINANDI